MDERNGDPDRGPMEMFVYILLLSLLLAGGVIIYLWLNAHHGGDSTKQTLSAQMGADLSAVTRELNAIATAQATLKRELCGGPVEPARKGN